MQKVNYQPKVCTCCGQSLTYLLSIDRGSVDILKAISTAIGRKGINCIHPRKEMEISAGKIDYASMVQEGHLTSNQVGNLSRPRFHGLIAKVKGDNMAGNYCLTTKGAKFLKGEEIPHCAIISKEKNHQIGYFEEDIYRCTIKDFTPDYEYWEGINFSIEEGKIIKTAVELQTKQNKLL